MLQFGWGLCEMGFLRIPVILRHRRVAGLHTLSSVQRRVNLAGLRLLSIERPAHKGGPLLASGHLALRVPPVNRKLMSLAHL